ncbi:MBL fold metallo-hydrolase [Erythrobacter sp. THAF29]|uniref:MBL fold metallo-hydrolase n=1 Tax=Erythrobacter sp. THAF29 TaxID=2587851 RepID=UPI001268B692|nr:MBL fold metallo-hydrolase [Erythrobacter sp. THAF29]QFT77441.1 Ribonuclease Z [Erythrobacter sp. THAF29]
MRKWIALGLLSFVVLGGLLVLVFQRSIGQRLFESVAAQRIVQNDLAFGEGLHLLLCGTGSPLPNPDRAGPCNLVVAGDQAFVVDIGEGGARNLNLMGFSIPSVDALLLTHYHSDHVDGIGPLALLYWTQGTKTAPLPVVGPQGLETLVEGFNQAYALDHDYRVAHHGANIVPETGGGLIARPFEIGEEPVVVLERDGLAITAFRVDHDPVRPAVGYRFDYRGRSLVISGDAARSPKLENVARGADLLVHDALQPKLVDTLTTALEQAGNDNVATITRDILDYHASPEEAAASAQIAGVKTLVLSHLVPPIPSAFFYPAFLGDAEERFDGEIVVGEDGMVFSFPPDSEAIETKTEL